MKLETFAFTSEKIYLISAREFVKRYPEKVGVCKETGKRYVRNLDRARVYFNLHGDEFCWRGRGRNLHPDYRHWQTKLADDSLRIKVVNDEMAFRIVSAFSKGYSSADLGQNTVRGSLQWVDEENYLFGECMHKDI